MGMNFKHPETPRRVLEWEAVQTLCMVLLIPSSSHHTTNNKLLQFRVQMPTHRVN